VTEVLAHSVIIPTLTDALVDGDPDAIASMDRAVIGAASGRCGPCSSSSTRRAPTGPACRPPCATCSTR
jgi:hypothetical protein